MTDADEGKTLLRIGLVATDEVRIAGLRAVLTDAGLAELVLLSEPGALERTRLEMVLVDAAATAHLEGLLESFRRLRPQIRLLVLMAEVSGAAIEQAIQAGARGVLSYEASEVELRMALEVVRDGSVWAPRKVLSRLLDKANEPAPAKAEVSLTRREVEVLRLLMQGLSNREIAKALQVEEASVKAHMGRMMRKAQVRNRTALGVKARALQWA